MQRIVLDCEKGNYLCNFVHLGAKMNYKYQVCVYPCSVWAHYCFSYPSSCRWSLRPFQICFDAAEGERDGAEADILGQIYHHITITLLRTRYTEQ